MVLTSADRIAPLEATHFWFVARDELFDRLLSRVAVIEPLLDLGCGTGRFAARLSARGTAVFATDLHLPSAPAAGPAFIASRTDGLPLRDASCNAVLARDVLEHVDDRAALAECRRVLRPGGMLLASVPGLPSLWSERDVRAGHLRRYRRVELEHLLRTSGFRMLELRGYPFLLLPLVIASRFVVRISGHRQLTREERVPDQVNRVLTHLARFEVALARFSWWKPPIASSFVVMAVRDD